jgi:hypothetical protein
VADDEQPSPDKVRRILMAKALGYLNSIRQLSREERLKQPSATLGNDYNTMRRQAVTMYPQFMSLMPPDLTIVKGRDSDFTEELLGEVLTFSEQLFQILETIGADTPPTRP